MKERGGFGDIGDALERIFSSTSTCTRARLSTEGKLFTCLFADAGHDLRALLRAGRSDDEIAAAIGLIWNERSDRYSEIRTAASAKARKIEMSYIGG